MPTATEQEKVVRLVGTKDNPARDPKVKPADGKGSVGDKVLTDSLIVVVVAWAFLIFLSYSLRHHNV